MSDQSRSQEDRRIRKWSKGPIYVGIMCHILVHRIFSTVVQIILRNINIERFELNPYNRCVENKMVNGKQCTLVCYLDDN